MKPLIIGLFGGTFDPFHIGHLHIARSFYTEIGLSTLYIVPTGQPYHRQTPAVASAHDRLAMVQLAIADEKNMRVEPCEIRRQGPSYTVNTLRAFRAKVGPHIPLWLLIGSDSLLVLHTWQQWPQLFELAHLAVALRPGFSYLDMAKSVKTYWDTCQAIDERAIAASGTIRPLSATPLDVSASAIRAAIAHDADYSACLPPAVTSYIIQHKLYIAGNRGQKTEDRGGTRFA